MAGRMLPSAFALSGVPAGILSIVPMDHIAFYRFVALTDLPRIQADVLALAEGVYFEAGTANIKPTSFRVLDGVVTSAPRFNEPILGGQAQIEGDFTA